MKNKIALENIQKLSKDEMAQLLYTLSQKNDEVYDRVQLLLLRNDPKELYKSIKKEITSIARGRKFIRYGESFAYAKKIDAIVDSIADNVTDKQMVFELSGSLIATDSKVYERSDDSAGVIQDAYHRAEDLWRSSLDGIDTESMYREYMKLRICDGFGIRSLMGREMPQEVLERIYDAIYEQAFHKNYKEYEHFSDLATLKECAHYLKRADMYIRAIKIWNDPPNERDWFDIAKEYRYCEDPKATIAALKKSGEPVRHTAEAFYTLKIWALEQLGLDLEITLAYRAWYEATEDPSVFKHYLSRLDSGLKERELKKALEKAKAMSPHRAIYFFETLDEKELAASYIMEQREDLETSYMSTKPFKSLIAWLKDDYPQAAILLYRDSTKYILQRAQSKYYGWVITALKSAKAIEDANDTDDWEIELHDEYIKSFLEKHKRKMRLMELYRMEFGE